MRRLSLLPLLLPSLLVAQAYVSPASFVHSEGLATQSFPFGVTTVPFRFCQVHDDVPAMTITGLAFRHNSTNVTYPAHSVTLDAWVSTAATTSATADPTFDNNHGPDKTQVVFNRTYNLPESNPNTLPGDFVLEYPFDLPFTFAGGASICWEVQITAKTQAASVFYDALTGGNADPSLATGRGDAGCISTGRTAGMTVLPTGPTSWAAGTASLNISGTQLLPGGAVFHVLGFDRHYWSALATPLPVAIPTTTGAPSGTCTIYEDPVFVMPHTASATGTVSIQLPVPAQLWLVGVTTYSQLLGLDAAANPFGLTASQLAMHNWVAPFTTPPIARVVRSGSLVATGTVTVGANTLITKFY